MTDKRMITAFCRLNNQGKDQNMFSKLRFTRLVLAFMLPASLTLALMTIAGCNTIEGVGEDVGAVGDGVANTAREANTDKSEDE